MTKHIKRNKSKSWLELDILKITTLRSNIDAPLLVRTAVFKTETDFFLLAVSVMTSVTKITAECHFQSFTPASVSHLAPVLASQEETRSTQRHDVNIFNTNTKGDQQKYLKKWAPVLYLMCHPFSTIYPEILCFYSELSFTNSGEFLLKLKNDLWYRMVGKKRRRNKDEK